MAQYNFTKEVNITKLSNELVAAAIAHQMSYDPKTNKLLIEASANPTTVVNAHNPAETSKQAEYAALTTDAQRISYLAALLGLE